MSLKTRKRLVLAIKEVTYGVDAAPTGANAMRVKDLKITPLDGNVVSRALDKSKFSADEDIQVTSFVGFEFKIEYQGSGTAAVAPAYAPLLLACARDEAVVVATEVNYTHNTDSLESITLYGYQDGQLHKAVGCRGNFKLTVNSQGIAYLEFRFVGMWVTPTSAAAPSPSNWSNFIKPVPVNNTYTTQLSLHGQLLTLKSLEYDQGNDVQHNDDPGEESVDIVDRKGSGRLSALAVAISVKDYFTTAKTNVVGALSLTHGTVAGEIGKFTAPAVQLIKPVYGDDNGRLTIDADLKFMSTITEDDETQFSLSRSVV